MKSIFDLIKKPNAQTGVSKPIDHIICGLGNPGEKYARTRHNAGFMCLDYLSQQENIKIDRLKFHSLTCIADIAGVRTLIMKPQTMMNLSGEAVGEAASFYKIPPENILVISDDITLDAGRLRIRRQGSDGGHNGLKSIISHLSTDKFPRLRIGVGIPAEGEDIISWVLGNIPACDKEALFTALGDACEAAKKINGGDINSAMNLYNRSGK